MDEYVVVPKEPTEAMLLAVERAGIIQRGKDKWVVIQECYAAMLAAAPKPQAPPMKEGNQRVLILDEIRFDSDCIVNGMAIKAGTVYKVKPFTA